MKKTEKWIKHWAGGFNLVYDTMLGLHNTKLIKSFIQTSLKDAIYIYRQGYTYAYFKEDSYKKFGKYVAKKIISNPVLSTTLAKQFIKIADQNMLFMKLNLNKQFDYNKFLTFEKLFNEYSDVHRPVKVVVDFLPDNVLKKVMPMFKKARMHAELVYEYHEKIIRNISKQVSYKTGYEYENLLALTNIELKKYFLKSVLPKESMLKKRVQGALVTYKNGSCKILTGKKVDTEERKLIKIFEQPILKGTVAFPGKVKGIVKIILDPFKPNSFKVGDILVTGMTRPEFLPLMKKAGGFITDAGGMLSHAAITAREFKKPCIVGTEIATKTLKDGDLVGLNADNGTIIKITK